jgi:glycosyltransferase involved in cell wall biosynthesis
LIVPVKNEAHCIEKLLSSIARQTRRPDEVIVVDGGSSDRTAEIAERWARQHELGSRLRVLRLAEATPGKGRNIGIAVASYDWLALTDAGISLEPVWLERLVEVAERNPELQVVYGNYEPVTDTFYEECAALAYVEPKHGRTEGRMRSPSIASTLLFRDVWHKVGGFPDLRAAEDRIFMRKVDERGVKVGWAPEATVWWQLPSGLRATYLKMALYSMHNVRAGEQKNWHYGVARLYVLAAVLAALLLMLHPGWLLLLPVVAMTRPWHSIWLRRERNSLLWTLSPARLLTVGLILVTIDLATFIGWSRALLTQPVGETASSTVTLKQK